MDTESIKIQHENSYRNAVLEIIKNNTDVLVDQDILSLLKKPPLDSMDYLKTKFLELAKKNKIVLDADNLDLILNNYRAHIIDISDDIKNIRVNGLDQILKKQKLENEHEVLKLNRKDFESINKKIIKMIKDIMIESIDSIIVKQSNKIYSGDVSKEIKDKILDEIVKTMKSNYRKQIIDNIQEKMVMKDITLINGVKEQGERYIFTITNSRLFHDLDV